VRVRRSRLTYAAAAAAAVSLAMLAAPAATASARTTPVGPVSATPLTQTPHLLNTAPSEQIRQLVQCGSTMYAVGTFTQIKRNSTTYTRNNVFSFSATSPFAVTSWAPDVNGIVNSIAFSGGNCASAYIGGKFTSVNGTTVKDIAEVSTSTGALVTAFGHTTSGQVETLASYGTHIIMGGYFTSTNGSAADPYLVSLNSTTGKDDGFISLNISGNYSFPGVSSNGTRVYNQAISHGGTLDLIMGDFTSVGGLPRQQIFMLNLATSPASVTGWTSPEFDGSDGNIDQPGGYPYQCATVEPYYIQAAAWSADDSTVYIGDTGYHPWNEPVGETPRAGLCDAAAAFPATQTSVLHEWVNYTGCDSMYAAAADASAAYFAGHERWADNPSNCDAAGPGAIPAPGIAGMVPTTGALMTNPAGTAGLYSRSRGLGADDLLVTSAGLWIASDNGEYTTVNGQQVWQASQTCGTVSGVSGICFLPYSS
jgi:hypothetical protein